VSVGLCATPGSVNEQAPFLSIPNTNCWRSKARGIGSCWRQKMIKAGRGEPEAGGA
jgi:hypothetical protein